MPAKSLASYVSRKWSFERSFESQTMQKILKITKNNIFEFAKKFDYYKQNIKRGSFERLADTDKFLKLMSDKFQNALLNVEKVIYSNSEHFFVVKWKDVNDDIKKELKKFFDKLRSFYNEFGSERNERTVFRFLGSLSSLNLTRDGIINIENKYKLCGEAWHELLNNWIYEDSWYLYDKAHNIGSLTPLHRSIEFLLKTIVETQSEFFECMKPVLERVRIWLKSIGVQDDRDLSKSFSSINDYKIFPNRLPRLEEVKQRSNVGDCYLVATLLSIVKQTPKAIRDCFLQSNAELKKADWIKVRLFKVDTKEYSSKEKDGIKTLKFIPKGYRVILVNRNKLDLQGTELWFGQGPYKALWPFIIEEAYNILRRDFGKEKQGPSQPGSSFAAIDGGYWEEFAMVSLTGKPVNVKHPVGKSEKSDLENYALFNKIKSALMKGKFITCSGGALDMRIKDNLTGKSVCLLGDHAYSVVNASESGQERVITLINPHREQDDPKSGIIGSNEFTMTYDDFQKFFIQVSISSNKKIVK